jgi:hypothetical protein
VSHRSIGSTGQRKQPSRVFKGKKMPGHMGEERVTTQGLQIFRVDGIHNMLFVKGHVPGGDNRFVLVRCVCVPCAVRRALRFPFFFFHNPFLLFFCSAPRLALSASRLLLVTVCPQVKDAIKMVQTLPVPTVLAAPDGSDSVLKEFDMAPQSTTNPWKPVRQY